ncbi:hypothetical protein TNCV_793721 [Trichonephila clavipes]|nr:hypothetical protein TNCV_793721 [Trichonephila clavipes]
MMDRISICEVLAKRKEIDPFLKQMVTGDEKGVTYDTIKRKRSWSKRGEVVQSVAKPELVIRKLVRLKPAVGQNRPTGEGCCVPSGQRQATLVCSDSAETLGAWLENFNTTTIQSGTGTKRLSPFSPTAKLPE